MSKASVLTEMKGWAWVTGLVPMAYLFRLENKSSEESLRAKSPEWRKDDARYEQSIYVFACSVLGDIATNARLAVKLPKKLESYRRKKDAYRHVESLVYRSFLPYGVGVAETVPFAMKIGVARFDETCSLQGDQQSVSKVLAALQESTQRAEIGFENMERSIQSYLSGAVVGSAMVSEVSELFFDQVLPGGSLRERLVDSLVVSPNFAGMGIDVKKLLGMKSRR